MEVVKMSETININDFKKEQKRRERKEWFNKKVNETAQWVGNNKEALAIIIPVVGVGIKGIAKIIKGVSRNAALKQERYLKENFIYDRSLGRHLELKKPLSNEQMKSILERKENGERLASILQNMNLLK